MSGHSKWSTIKHKKGAADAARSKIFAKHAKLIAIAARGGSDPDTNANLKTAILNAKSENVPNDNINRAIKKGSGSDKNAVEYQELSYEGYAPNGIAIIIEALTDNNNRAYSNIRTIMEKNGGNLGEKGSVSYMFTDKGYLELVIANQDLEKIEMDILESKAEDFEISSERIFITTAFADLGAVRDDLKNKGYQIENTKKQKISSTYVNITDLEIAKKFLKLTEALEEDDDVSEIYHNAEIDDSIINAL